MNPVKTVTDSQSIYTDKGHHGETGFELIKKTAGSIIGKTMGASVPKSPVTGSVRSTLRGRKNDAKIRLEDDQMKEIRVQPIIKRAVSEHFEAEFHNNMEGAGDGYTMSNNWDQSDKEPRPAHIPSYLQPTLSYRMKCVHKPKNDTEDGQRIPFVVGNYANKSHNVGSKIQETLSLIKGAPRRVLEKTKREKEELGNLMRCMTATAQPIPPLARSQGDITRHEATIMKWNRSANSMDARITTIDCKNHQIRTVLMNLQDEFAKMNNKYEELKKSLKAKYNVEVAHRILNLEEELKAKDTEINAFVNLYNEVIQLKKMLINRKVEVKNERPTAIQLQSEGFQEHGITTSKSAYTRKLGQLYDQAKNKVH